MGEYGRERRRSLALKKISNLPGTHFAEQERFDLFSYIKQTVNASCLISKCNHKEFMFNLLFGPRMMGCRAQTRQDTLKYVTDLNLLGTILPSQVFGKVMTEQKEGVILNVSSMTAFRPLTRIAAYSAAKAAVTNFTQWLAVHMAQEYSPKIRVNAIAPGFFLTEQNRFLLTEKETGALTARGQRIIEHTPMARFGQPEDLVGAVLWLLSPASKFVTGIVLPVDGGFSAYAGV